MNLIDYGFIPTMLPENSGGTPARITATHRNRYEFISDDAKGFATLKTGEYYNNKENSIPTTGDFVLLDYIEGSESRIIKTLPRNSYFSRLDPSSSGHGEQAVAANFDYVFIIQSLNHDFNPNRLQRYLALAWQSGAIPAVILTKADLVEDFTPQIRTVEKLCVGISVFAISTKTGYGLEMLNEYMKPRKTIVFLGSSGVGKSSLVNTLAGSDVMNVREIREDDSRGRHATTHRQLIMLPTGVMVIDTPGMRELGMWNASDGLAQSFSDVEQYFGKCKFKDCKHDSEPGCAIKKAIEDGELSPSRWENYKNLKDEVKYSDNKAEYLRQKEQWHKNITKTIKQMKQFDKI